MKAKQLQLEDFVTLADKLFYDETDDIYIESKFFLIPTKLTSPRPSPSPSQIQKGRGEFGLWAVMNSIMNTVINTVMKPMMIL